MNAHPVVLRAGLLIGFASAMAGMPTAAQTTPPKEAQTPAPGLRKLTGEDEQQAKQLAEQIDKAVKADRWDDAIARAEELLTLRARTRGPKHFETVTEDWRVRTLRRVARLSHEDRVAYRSAITMKEEADSLSAQGKYSEAQPLYERALEIRRRLLTDDHPDTAASYNKVAANLDDQGKHAQGQILCEKALDINRRVLTDEHPNTAHTYSELAFNLNLQGKYALAQPLCEKALEILRRLLTDDHSDTARAYHNLAFNLNSQGKHSQAQRLFEKALDIFRRLLGEEHADTAGSYDSLAQSLNAQGKYARAQPLYEKALEIRRRLLTDDHPSTAVSFNNVAVNLAAQGKVAQAQPLFEKALEINRRLFTDDHPYTAASYNNVAAVLGNPAQAQKLLEKALEIRRRLLTDDHPHTAHSYNNLAFNLNLQGKYALAQPLFEKALQIKRRLLTDDHPDTARGYGNVALNLNAQGKYALALPLYEKALEINRRLLTDDHPSTAGSYNNVARTLSFLGKYSEAQPLYQTALVKFRRLLTDDHGDTARIYGNLASNLNAQGKYLQAQDQWLRSVKSLDAARLRVAFTGLERLLTKEESARTALAAVLARLGEPAKAWQPLEEDLGRGLLDELAARQDRRLTSAERDRLRELTRELDRLDRLVEADPKGLGQAERAKRFDDLKRQHELASIALGEFQTKLVQAHGPLAGQVASLSEIQAALPADAALVAWVDIPPFGPGAADPDGEHWGVVVRSRGTPAWVPIAGTGSGGLWTKEDNWLAVQVRTELRSRPGDRPLDVRSLVTRLRAQRIEPLEKALGATALGLPPTRRLIVLPSVSMAGVPVEVLLTADDTRTVSYAPSASVYKYLHEQPQPDRRAGLLALGDPVFVTARSAGEQFTPLPGTRYEVEALAQLFKADDRPTLALLAADASEPELDRLAASGELSRFLFIHLATHAVIDEGVPIRSAVILTQTGLPDPLEQVLHQKPVFDGRLTVREIQRSWDLKADLVTLSACETALGRDTGGEGFVGFTQALLMSGARSVCLSLWRVDDKATSLLMSRFYQNLLGKRPALSIPMPKAEALQEAKQWLRSLTLGQVDGELAALERGELRPLAKVNDATTAPSESTSRKLTGKRPYDDPYFWAAFVLVGDPD